MERQAIFSIAFVIFILLLLIPPVIADGNTIPEGPSAQAAFFRKLAQDKHHALFSADDSIAEGDRAKQGGDYVEALGNYNNAIDQIQNSRLAQPEKNKKLAEIYRHKAELYRVRQSAGDDALAQQADETAASYIQRGTYYGPGSCFTTLTYNRTPLESTVQQVRDFRDGSVQKSYTGSLFMEGFNAWYYSFSPAITGYIGEHPVLKTFLSFDLAPLLGIVLVSQGVFNLLNFNAELAAVSALVTGGALYGIFYIFPYASIGMIAAARRGWRIPEAGRIRSLCLLWIAALALTAAGSVCSLDLLTGMSSCLLVICSMILAAGAASLTFCGYIFRLRESENDRVSPVVKAGVPEYSPD